MKEIDSEDEDEMTIYKVILVGETNVGKTCIMTRFIKGIFKENLGASLSASYAEKIIKLDKFGGKEIQFGIWEQQARKISFFIKKFF